MSDTNSINVLLKMQGVQQVKTGIDEVTSKAKTLGKTVDDANRLAARSAGFARHEMLNLGYQAQDVVVSLASGQKPLTVLLQQGSQVGQILMASQVTMSGFFRQLATGAAAAARPLAILGAAVATLAAGWTGFQAALAEGGAEKAMASLGESNRMFGDTILRQLDDFVRSGRLSVERAKEIAADIRGAFSDGHDRLSLDSKMPLGAGGLNASAPKLVADLLVSFGQELRSKLPPQLTKAGLEAHRAAGMARVEAEKEIQDRLAKMQLAELENSYQAGTVSLEGFLARRRQIATEEHQREIKMIETQQHDLRVRILAADGDEKAKLAINAAALLEKRRMTEIDFAAELNQITADGLKERTKLEEEASRKRKQAAAEELQLKQQALQLDLAMAASDWRKTDTERFSLQRDRIDRGQSEGAVTGPEADLMRLQQGPNPESFTEQMTSGIQRMTDAWGTFQQQLAGTTFNTIQAGIDGAANNLAHAAVVTGDWLGALRNIRVAVLTEIVGSFIQMAAQWVATHVIMKGVSSAWSAFSAGLKAKDAATTATAEGAKAAAAMPAATAMSISSWGLAAVIGLAAIASAFSGGFKEGGYTGNIGTDEIAGVVHGREFVLPADVTAAIGPANLQGMVNAVRSPVAARGTTAAPSAPSASGGSGETFIFHDLDSALDAFMASPATEKRLMRMLNGRAVEMGIRR
jgi:hypothetical protein